MHLLAERFSFRGQIFGFFERGRQNLFLMAAMLSLNSPTFFLSPHLLSMVLTDCRIHYVQYNMVNSPFRSCCWAYWPCCSCLGCSASWSSPSSRPGTSNWRCCKTRFAGRPVWSSATSGRSRSVWSSSREGSSRAGFEECDARLFVKKKKKTQRGHFH